jgi:hypothetical protein
MSTDVLLTQFLSDFTKPDDSSNQMPTLEAFDPVRVQQEETSKNLRSAQLFEKMTYPAFGIGVLLGFGLVQQAFK